MAGLADAAGFRLVAEPEAASVIVVNTCGFIGPAKKESIDTILGMARHKEAGSCERLVVAGCLAQRYPHELAAELPEVDHFLGTSDVGAIAAVLGGEHERMSVGDPGRWVYSAATPRLRSTPAHTAYVKIAEGCSRRCSFCVIPTMRGTQRSRPVADIVAEVSDLAARGALEINLVSQDTISYGRDLGDAATLARLAREVARVPGPGWVRLLYLYPERLDDELVAAIRDEPRVAKYVDLPLQHASSRMLRIMRRGVGSDGQKRLIERLRDRIDGLTIRTAFIVGHPGETDADFQELCDLVEWARFDHVGVFRYSPEEGTRSSGLPDPVPARVAAARFRRLMSLQRRVARERNRAFVGRRIQILVEGPSDESEYLLVGRHAGQAPEIDGVVYLADWDGADPPIGRLVDAQVTQSADYDLAASLLPRG